MVDFKFRQIIKNIIQKVPSVAGYRLSRIEAKQPQLWFNYTAYPLPSMQTILEKYLKAVNECQTVCLFGYTDLARSLADKLISQIPPPGKVVCIVDKLVADRQSSSKYHEIPIVHSQKAIDLNPECYVLCDLNDWYSDYKLLRSLGCEHSRIVHHSLFHQSPWKMSDFYIGFRKLLADMPETMLDDARQLVLVECVRYCSRLKGDVLEIGTYKGGSGFLICQTLNAMGMRKQVTLIDWYQHQSAEVSLATVKETFARFDFAEVISGKAEDILSTLPEKPLCFAHIDVNADETIVDRVLPVVYSRLVPGGMMLFDNYYFRSLCKYNFDRFANQINEHIILLPSIPQGLLIKSQT